MHVYIIDIIPEMNVTKTLVNMSVMMFVTGVFYVIIEYCRFGCLRQYIKDKQDHFIDTMDDDCTREAAKTEQYSQQRTPSDTRYVTLSPGKDTSAEFTIVKNDDMVSLTTKDLVCYLFQIARGMEFLASMKVSVISWK